MHWHFIRWFSLVLKCWLKINLYFPMCVVHFSISRFSLVDHPTQLICIWIFICWVGGGDPCGVAELCKSAPSDQKKQAKTNIFSKYPCHVHKDCLEAKNGTKNLMKPPKKPVCFVPLSPLAQNSWNEGSLVLEISKTRDPSFWKFLKRGKYTLLQFCKKYQLFINAFLC